VAGLEARQEELQGAKGRGQGEAFPDAGGEALGGRLEGAEKGAIEEGKALQEGVGQELGGVLPQGHLGPEPPPLLKKLLVHLLQGLLLPRGQEEEAEVAVGA
jgi:hypothetical protein